MADIDLFCNNIKCKKRLVNFAWITSCSHAFCEEEADQIFLKGQENFSCPACNSSLPDKHDIVKVDFNPSEKFKSMVLAGLRPEIIIDITSRALTFWQYQMYHELQYQKALLKRSSDNMTLAEETYDTQIMKMRAELQAVRRSQEALEQEVENQARHIGELQNRIVEKNRQLQSLMATNNKLRCNTAMAQADPKSQPVKGKYYLGPKTLSDIRPVLHEINPNTGEQDFVFNPSSADGRKEYYGNN